MIAHRILNRLFQREEINGRERCATYLYRWTVFQPRLAWLKGLGVYVHHFVGDDWSRDMHDHPKRFISIGLKGQYLEHTPRGTRIYQAPWLRTFPADHIHRLTMIDGGECWTVVVVLRAVRPWGFWHFGRFIPWRDYVTSETADKRKACI